MRFLESTGLIASVALVLLAACADGNPPPRVAGGPADPSSPETPMAPTPSALPSTGMTAPAASGSDAPPMPPTHHHGS